MYRAFSFYYMKISKHFTYKEALYLPQWKRTAKQSDGLTQEVLDNLKLLFSKMDKLRDFFGKPIIVHVAYRPAEYNRLVGGARGSSHMSGMACDFHVAGLSCDEVRDQILKAGLLDTLQLRMENLPGSNWVHLDTRKPGPSGRFFKP